MTADHTRPDMVALLQHYGAEPVHGSAGERKVRCPFHGERNPSATVNLAKQVFCCHACGMAGDVYSLIMRHEGVTFREALNIGDRIDPAADQPPQQARMTLRERRRKARSEARG